MLRPVPLIVNVNGAVGGASGGLAADACVISGVTFVPPAAAVAPARFADVATAEPKKMLTTLKVSGLFVGTGSVARGNTVMIACSYTDGEMLVSHPAIAQLDGVTVLIKRHCAISIIEMPIVTVILSHGLPGCRRLIRSPAKLVAD